MPGQESCATPVIVTLPAQINAATVEQINAAFKPGVTVVADLTSTACRDCSAILHLLRAHRRAAGRQVRFAIRPGGPLHRISEFADIPPPPGDHAPSRRPPSPHCHLSGCLGSGPERDANGYQLGNLSDPRSHGAWSEPPGIRSDAAVSADDGAGTGLRIRIDNERI
jgi:hypothetical protein